MSIQVVVPDEETKRKLKRQSRCLHDEYNIDPDDAGTLMHLHLIPDENWIIRQESETCTPKEREFLDAMYNKGYEGYRCSISLWPEWRDPNDCPYCGYDGRGPKTERLEKATIALLDEYHGIDTELKLRIPFGGILA